MSAGEMLALFFAVLALIAAARAHDRIDKLELVQHREPFDHPLESHRE